MLGLVIIGIIVAVSGSLAALLLGAPWWEIVLIYIGAGSLTVLGGAILLYVRTSASPSRRKQVGSRPMPTAEPNG